MSLIFHFTLVIPLPRPNTHFLFPEECSLDFAVGDREKEGIRIKQRESEGALGNNKSKSVTFPRRARLSISLKLLRLQGWVVAVAVEWINTQG
jgi:hypothetical protein